MSRLALTNIERGHADVVIGGEVVGYVQKIDNCGRWYGYAHDTEPGEGPFDAEPVDAAGDHTRAGAVEQILRWLALPVVGP